ncbi:MAG: hypothetical protein OXH48_00470 [Chloroflexi bacterium]|nr:hypothetical protein [Chloroflexota bacterium]MCY3582438.1 hypothetical protein [Chloroflexota bacterium]MXV93813.1 hypothetical protein [Chloroflexota bacterium]MXX50152.1 hypothetical protein [Chloroflexota bacterium]MYC54451.1 hypothetical protein [Chloroflexota bacterium]
MDIKRVLDTSYHNALRALAMGTSAAALARARERVFVKALAAQLLASCGDENARVFHAYSQDWQAVFGASAPPGEIRVCRMDSAEISRRQAHTIDFVAETVWLAAIDFTRDLASALQAVNRLKGGAARNKLLALARSEHSDIARLGRLQQPFAGENHFLALLPHPSQWDEAHEAPALWRLADGEWLALA